MSQPSAVAVREERVSEASARSAVTSILIRLISHIRAVLSCFCLLLYHSLLLVSDIVPDRQMNERDSKKQETASSSTFAINITPAHAH